MIFFKKNIDYFDCYFLMVRNQREEGKNLIFFQENEFFSIFN